MKMSSKESRTTEHADLSSLIPKGEEGVVDMFVHPPLSSKDEKDSFNYQSVAFNTTSGPSQMERERILHRLEEVFGASRYKVPEDVGTLAHVRRVVALVAKKSGDKSPGAVFQRDGFTTNKDVFENLGEEAVSQMVYERIKLLTHPDTTPERARQIADPIKLFIKREPHKSSKAVNKRWRLIWGISLIDQIIDRVVYGEMVDAALKAHDETPNKPGFNFKYGGVNKLACQYETHTKTWRSFDAKSFDITAPGWGLEIILDLNIRLNDSEGTPRERWERLARQREQASLYGSFVFSDGTVCRKMLPGLQPSGRFTTIDSNGKLMGLFRCWWDITTGVPTQLKSWISMGDDSVQNLIPSVEAFISFHKERCGVTLTDETGGGPGFFTEQNFCSFRMKEHCGKWVPVPLNWEKNLYALAFPEKSEVDYTGDRLRSLCIEYAFHEKVGHFRSALAASYGSLCRSQQWCENIITGFESWGPSRSGSDWKEPSEEWVSMV